MCNTATKCVECATRHNFSVEITASAKMSEKFIALKVNIEFFCYIDVLHKISSASYFMNYLWTSVFVSTRKSNAAKFIARKELEWMLSVLKASSFEKKSSML